VYIIDVFHERTLASSLEEAVKNLKVMFEVLEDSKRRDLLNR